MHVTSVDSTSYSRKSLPKNKHDHILFSVEKTFRENTPISSRSFFPFTDFAHIAQNRWCLVYYIRVACHCGKETKGGEFESSCQSNFFQLFSLEHSYFFKKKWKTGPFRQKGGFYDKWTVLSQKLSFLRCKRNKLLNLNIFQKIERKFPILLKKNEDRSFQFCKKNWIIGVKNELVSISWVSIFSVILFSPGSEQTILFSYFYWNKWFWYSYIGKMPKKLQVMDIPAVATHFFHKNTTFNSFQ